MYQIEKDEYSKLTKNAVKSMYKKIPNKISNKVIANKKNTANKEEVNRILLSSSNSWFITLKYRGLNFLNNSKLYLLELAKNKLSRISKSILNRINTSLRNLIKVNQWKYNSQVIEWFKNIGNKQKQFFFIWHQRFLSNNHKRSINKMLKVCWRKISNFWWR